MQMNNKKGNVAELAYVMGMILCPLGVCLSAKSGFGVSMVVAPAYVLYLRISETLPWFTFGKSEYIFQGLLLIVLGIAVRRFKWKYLLSFVTAFLYGNILDLWYDVLGAEQYTVFWQRGMACVLGTVITSLAIAFFLRTYLPQEAYEMFVKDISDTFHKDTTKVKWIFDFTALCIAVILMLVLFRRFAFDMVGFNTVLATIVNAPLIGIFGKILDRAGSFDSSFPQFYEKFQSIMN